MSKKWKMDSHVTITDVARAANVSRTLVSFVLNGRKDVAPATRDRILQAIEELGYRPNTVARNLATKRAGAIGIVCDMETYQDPLDMQFLAAILTTVSQMERRVMLIPADDQQIQEMAQDYAVDGFIFLDERGSDPRITHLLDMGIPAVGLWNDHWDAALRKGFVGCGGCRCSGRFFFQLDIFRLMTLGYHRCRRGRSFCRRSSRSSP